MEPLWKRSERTVEYWDAQVKKYEEHVRELVEKYGISAIILKTIHPAGRGCNNTPDFHGKSWQILQRVFHPRERVFVCTKPPALQGLCWAASQTP